MGVKLIVEVMDHWQDAGLSRAERDDLLVLAENANDSTRETFKSVHEEYILRRAGKKPESWRNAIDALKRKGVLEYAVRDGQQMAGRPGRHAVYRVRILCPESPHDGLWGQCTREERVIALVTHPDECVTALVTHSGAMGNQSDDPSNCLGNQGGAECVTRAVTPSPPVPSVKNSPQKTSPSSASADGPDWLADGGGGDDPKSQRQQQAEALVAALPINAATVDPKRRRQLHAGVVAALAAGWTDADLKGELLRELGNVRSPVGVWLTRLKPDILGPPRDVAAAPANDKPCVPGACDGHDHPPCDHGQIERANGSWYHCPCSPMAKRSEPKPGEHQTFRNPDPSAYYDPKTKPRDHQAFQNFPPEEYRKGWDGEDLTDDREGAA